MKTLIAFLTLALMPLMLTSRFTYADVVKSSPEHYTLKQQAESSLPPNELWQRLIKPETWWHPDHTYSGDSANLSLDAQAGGMWREDWSTGSVVHGQVLLTTREQAIAVKRVFWTLARKSRQRCLDNHHYAERQWFKCFV